MLLVRSQTGATSRERVEYMLRKPAFDALRDRIGDDGLLQLLDERVEVIDGDFGRAVPEIPAGIDIAMPLGRDGRASTRRSTRGS